MKRLRYRFNGPQLIAYYDEHNSFWTNMLGYGIYVFDGICYRNALRPFQFSIRGVSAKYAKRKMRKAIVSLLSKPCGGK